MQLAAESQPAQESGVDMTKMIDVTPEQDGGILKEILKEGEGDETPCTNAKVSVHYVGTLQSDGSKFDSSRDRDEQFEFKLGKGEVIKAWDIGVASMKRGEICKLVCRSDYAYGAAGSPPKIPGGATLVFEIELFDWVTGEDISENKDGGIIKVSCTGGEGYSSPNDGAWVKVDLKGCTPGSLPFDERTVEFELGEGCLMDIPEGVEIGISKMVKKETCTLKIKSKYAFGVSGKEKFGVSPDTDVEYMVTLLDFRKAKEKWDLSQEEKIDEAKLCKEKGTKYFKENNLQMAKKFYDKVADLMSYDSGLSDEKKEENHVLKLAAELNLSLVCLKMKDFVEAKNHADKALEQDGDNVKALYRKAQAFQEMNDSEMAISLYKRVLQLEPENSAAQKYLQLATAQHKKHLEKEKKIFSGMFEKFAAADAKRKAQNKKGVLNSKVGEWESEEEKMEAEDRDELSNVDVISSSEEINVDNLHA